MGEVFGWLSAIAFGVCALPQAASCVRSGNADGLSGWFLALWGVGEVFAVPAVLIDLGVVWWLLANYAVNGSCLLVICRYKIFPKARNAMS